MVVDSRECGVHSKMTRESWSNQPIYQVQDTPQAKWAVAMVDKQTEQNENNNSLSYDPTQKALLFILFPFSKKKKSKFNSSMALHIDAN